MVQTVPQFTTFDEFVAWYPENGQYELINGSLCEVKPTGPHEQVGAYLNRKLTMEIDRLDSTQQWCLTHRYRECSVRCSIDITLIRGLEL